MHHAIMGKLPAEGTQARRFGKTRSAQSTALLEDYVELIADLLESEGEARPTDIARRLGVSHATAIKTIARVKRAGFATARPYRGVFLTEKGEALAASGAGAPPARGRSAARARRAKRSRGGRRRRHRALCLGDDAEGVRAIPEGAWLSHRRLNDRCSAASDGKPRFLSSQWRRRTCSSAAMGAADFTAQRA